MWHGADADARDEDGNTALHMAVLYRRTDAIKLLLQHGATVDSKRPNGDTPLYFAIDRARSPPCAKLLLAAGASMSLMEACGFRHRAPTMLKLLHGTRDGDGELVRLMLRHNADEPELTRESVADLSPVHVAAFLGERPKSRLLWQVQPEGVPLLTLVEEAVDRLWTNNSRHLRSILRRHHQQLEEQLCTDIAVGLRHLDLPVLVVLACFEWASLAVDKTVELSETHRWRIASIVKHFPI